MLRGRKAAQLVKEDEMGATRTADPTWRDTMLALRECTSEEQAKALLDKEVAGPNRRKWKKLILGRIRVLRNDREEQELGLTEDHANG